MHFKPQWVFKQWIPALHAEIISIKCRTIVLYLEAMQQWDDVPPIKNGLETMCKVIRQHQPTSRIFVANLLPRVGGRSPVVTPINEVNFILLQAVRSVNQALGKIHYLSIYEHFISRKGRVIRPTSDYFREDSNFTRLGCMTFRKCVLRETGLKSYWF